MWWVYSVSRLMTGPFIIGKANRLYIQMNLYLFTIYHVTLTFVECVPVDLVFVMDDSGSVSEENFQTMLTFASDLLNSFKIGEKDTRVGLITFSSSARRIFNFDAYSLRTQIQTAIKETLYNAGGTNTADALQEARQMFVFNDAKRSNALSLAIVLTDGQSNSAVDTVDSANNLHNADVMVFCIGIGSNLNENELRAIASNPDDKFLINANDFTTLHSKITQLTNSLCIGKLYKNVQFLQIYVFKTTIIAKNSLLWHILLN